MLIAQTAADWSKEWLAIDDATYLNTAAGSPLPRVAVRAVFEASQPPHRITDSLFFDVPNRLRGNLATLSGGTPIESALTAGASTGMAALSHLANARRGPVNWAAQDS